MCTTTIPPTRQVQEEPGVTSRISAGSFSPPARITFPFAPFLTSGEPRPSAPRTYGDHLYHWSGRATSAQRRSGDAELRTGFESGKWPGYQPSLPGSPLIGPVISSVIQPP